nr:uncharacterized protein LOC100186090 [Ciona intestinalis]|eukprot:XP_009861417.2 uncharacterized protein LOC100186090 [Ciona intestinalis]
MGKFYFCVTLSILLRFAASVMTTNTTTFHPTEATMTPQTSNGITLQDCPRICALRLKGTRLKMFPPYHSCMKECTGTWPVVPGQCRIQASVVDSNSNPVCAPISVNTSEIGVFDPVQQKTLGYAVVSWLPCPYGLRDANGFQVIIQAITSVHYEQDCHNLTLTRPLQREDAQIRFSVLSHLPLIPDTEYTVEIRSLPITPNSNYASGRFTSKKCLELNGQTNCRCGNTLDSLQPPTMTVKGYSVTMSIPQLASCYKFRYYQAELAYWMGLSHSFPSTFLRSNKEYIYSSEEVLEHTFAPVYNSASGRGYVGLYSSFFQGDFEETDMFSMYRDFEIRAWEPPKPTIETPNTRIVDVKFEPANSSYHILHYMVRLNKHDPQYSSITIYSTLEEKNVSATNIENGFLKVRYYDLQPGVYSAQVREIRQDVDLPSHMHDKSRNITLFADAVYGEYETFTVPYPYATTQTTTMALTVGVPVSLLLAILAILAIGSLYLWKAGHCGIARSYMPGSMIKWLDSQTVGSMLMRSRNVLLVWQNDVRSTELQEKHAEVIRHFAAYLRSVCGLNIILDVYEEPQLISAASMWMQNSFEQAEFVLFICPHYNVDEYKDKSVGVVGDFGNAFRYMENQIRDKKRYVTVLLPYADIECWQTNKWLQNMTRVYKIMDQIEDLYFHIQERSKLNFSGRHTVEYVSKADYVRTKEGRAFREAVLRFRDVMNQPIVMEETTEVEESDAPDEQEQISMLMIDIIPPQPLPPPCGQTDRSIHLAPPPPLVEKPEEEIRLINAGLTNVEPCPFHREGYFPSYPHSQQAPTTFLEVPEQPLEQNITSSDPDLSCEINLRDSVGSACEMPFRTDSGFGSIKV